MNRNRTVNRNFDRRVGSRGYNYNRANNNWRRYNSGYRYRGGLGAARLGLRPSLEPRLVWRLVAAQLGLVGGECSGLGRHHAGDGRHHQFVRR
ncbi:hypothetical protein [Synechococcus sp. CS-205]|uniref:hypothetical protein n=1 Tax=Synechococcus sp. CS-205 TaxID=2847984 RepID=UPI00223C25F4|nr:hypothetical protein [Synechococcus sp. CS-205]MCT0248099.1 hypothetical protein [Synechococcus sp. CS-205]